MSILAQEDLEKYLFRPDEDIMYTSEVFMKNLNLPSKKLKVQLESYCHLVAGKIKAELTLSKQELDPTNAKPCSDPKDKPADPARVMSMLLTFQDTPKKIADIRRVENGIWILQQLYSTETGVNLFNQRIEPNIIDLNVALKKIQEIKSRVKKALQKGKIGTLIEKFEKEEM